MRGGAADVRIRSVMDSAWRGGERAEGRYGNIVTPDGYGYFHLAVDRAAEHAAFYIGLIDRAGTCWFGGVRGSARLAGTVCEIDTVRIIDLHEGSVRVEGQLTWAALGADRRPQPGSMPGTFQGEWRVHGVLVEVAGGIRPTKTEARCAVRLEADIAGERLALDGPGFADHGWGRIDVDQLGGWNWVFATDTAGSWTTSATVCRGVDGWPAVYGWFHSEAGIDPIMTLTVSRDALALATPTRTLKFTVRREDHLALRGGAPGRRGPLDEAFCTFLIPDGARDAIGVVEELILPRDREEAQ